MKKTLSIILIIFLIILPGVILESIPTGVDRSLTLDAKKINANEISAWVRNNGGLHRDPVTMQAGFEWPKGTLKTAIYESGLWLGAKIADSIHVALAYYDYEFLPGYIDFSTQTPNGKDDPLYRIYKVSPIYPDGGNGFDTWSSWPVSQGAPWVDVNNNGIYEPPTDYPVMKGDQNMFCAFTDGYPESHTNFSGSTGPLNADVHLYVCAKANPQCADVIYMEYKIINKKNVNWDSLFIGFWSDPDLGNATDDKTGCDSSLDLGYVYNGSNYDGVYGTNPPAVGYVLYGVSRHNNRMMDAFNPPRKNAQEPTNYKQVFAGLKGLIPRLDTPYINPLTNQPTKYVYSGDPESSTGWLDPSPDDVRFFLSSYIGEVVPLDTINFNVAVLIKKGNNNLNSVTAIKNCVNQVIGISRLTQNLPSEFELSQNYPNPFNPVTKIRFSVPLNKGGLRGLSVKLTIYDILGREVATPINQEMKPGRYEVEWDGSNFASGVYFYKLEAGPFVETKKMVLIK